MSLNISPETKVGKVLDWEVEDYLNKSKDITYDVNFEGEKLSLTKDRLNEFLEESKLQSHQMVVCIEPMTMV